MDSFSSELSDGQLPGLSMSLVSYGSDLDNSIDDSLSNLKTKTTVNSLSDADTVIEDELRATDDTIIDPVMIYRKRAQQLSCTGLSLIKKKEVEAALTDTVAAQTEYLETMEIFRALESVISSEKLPQPTKEMAQKLLLRQELTGYVDTDEGTGLLGLSKEHLWADCPSLLSETDQKIVQLAVEGQLVQTARELKQVELSKNDILNKLSTNASNSAGIKVEADHTSRMSALRAELNNELDKYYKCLSSLDTSLEIIVQLRTNKMSETCMKVIDGFDAKAQLLKQKARLINKQIQSAIYTEDANIVPAMRCLEKDLDLLYSEMDMQLVKSRGLLAAYDRVRCPEYNNILEEYCYTMTQIKSVEYLLKETRNWS